MLMLLSLSSLSTGPVVLAFGLSSSMLFGRRLVQPQGFVCHELSGHGEDSSEDSEAGKSEQLYQAERVAISGHTG